MPIIERTPNGCFRAFQDDIASVIGQTVPTASIVRVLQTTEDAALLAFWADDPIAACIETDVGPLYLAIANWLYAEPVDEGYQLRTRSYAYRLLQDEDPRSGSLIRWEREARPHPPTAPARHHIQAAAQVALCGEALNLDRLHLPTAYVTVEDVIRFLIVDLGMDPPCGAAWPDVLEESKGRFEEDYRDLG